MSEPLPIEPTLTMVRAGQPCLWVNPNRSIMGPEPLDLAGQINEATDRLARADGLLRSLFDIPESNRPVLSSALVDASQYARSVHGTGAWYLKADDALPVAGSVKARGGFHEVIAFAERLAIENGLVDRGVDLIALDTPAVRSLFSTYTVAVGSTGNLGLAIGVMASALGFRAVVHMSNDAKEWKKNRLRDRGVEVVEHPGDYAQAVALGREVALSLPRSHFVDDERSVDLFVGYAAAARELKRDLDALGIVVDADSPLFVYLPCGVGGAPGGIAFGLKLLFGEAVHCFFAEPVASPCMLVQLSSDSEEPISVYDIGLDNRTELDGLAVGQASTLVAPLMRSRLSGIYTVSDDEAFRLLGKAHELLRIDLEPSAAAALAGPTQVLNTQAGRAYIASQGLSDKLSTSTHVMWTTGGSIVPDRERIRFLDRARLLDAPQV